MADRVAQLAETLFRLHQRPALGLVRVFFVSSSFRGCIAARASGSPAIDAVRPLTIP
jgi:hypothetical protein